VCGADRGAVDALLARAARGRGGAPCPSARVRHRLRKRRSGGDGNSETLGGAPSSAAACVAVDWKAMADAEAGVCYHVLLDATEPARLEELLREFLLSTRRARFPLSAFRFSFSFSSPSRALGC
jgi:hypothetical protein